MNIKEYIKKLIDNKIPATIYLINGIKLQGTIISYDDEGKSLCISSNNNNNSCQLVLLQAVSTIS